MSLECKGRNGYFKFGSFWVFKLSEVSGEYPAKLVVDIESTRPGKAAPISISGPAEKVIGLFENILTKLKAKNSAT